MSPETCTVAEVVEEQIRLMFAELADLVAEGQITLDPKTPAASKLSPEGVPLALFAGQAVLLTAWRRFIQSGADGDTHKATWGPLALGPETELEDRRAGPNERTEP